ncbi:AMP-binding protein [Kibdelosporangium lantanae]|uniref:AMP-binding protein n=1 Tax=Kibdelosporangium lantanae TaxID=1497396 RepID=A0ABW3MJ52_9PSEU
MCGGGAVDEALADAYERIIGVPMTNAWGMTETSPVVTVSRVSTVHDHLKPEQKRRLVGTPGPPIPFGRLLPSIVARVIVAPQSSRWHVPGTARSRCRSRCTCRSRTRTVDPDPA